MSSMVARRYRGVDATNLKGGYQGPSVVSVKTSNHRDGHYVRPNRVALKYPDFKKNASPNVHVRMFNSIVKANAEIFEEYIINAFSYMLRDMTWD
jgi:hypothetical protein